MTFIYCTLMWGCKRILVEELSYFGLSWSSPIEHAKQSKEERSKNGEIQAIDV